MDTKRVKGIGGYLVACYATLHPAMSVRWSVGWSVGRLVGRSVGWSITLELKSGKTRISAPAHPSATGGRVSGLVISNKHYSVP